MNFRYACSCGLIALFGLAPLQAMADSAGKDASLALAWSTFLGGD